MSSKSASANIASMVIGELSTQLLQSSVQDASPPGSVRLLRKQLRGLRAAQGVERSAAREQQIGELEYELEERERKYRRSCYRVVSGDLGHIWELYSCMG